VISNKAPSLVLGCAIPDCNRLFAMEKKWVELSNESRHEERLKDAKPLLDEFWQWVSHLNPLQNSNLGKAITYALNRKR
jgi:transposase